eukprot:Partr_v1_DN28609_c0_g1_i1_m49445
MSLEKYLSAKSRDRHIPHSIGHQVSISKPEPVYQAPSSNNSSRSSLLVFEPVSLRNHTNDLAIMDTIRSPVSINGGYLQKKGSLMSWKKVWVRITDTALEVCKDQSSHNVQLEIPYLTIISISVKASTPATTRHDFTLKTTTGDYLFGTELSDIRDQWLEAIKIRLSSASTPSMNEERAILYSDSQSFSHVNDSMDFAVRRKAPAIDSIFTGVNETRNADDYRLKELMAEQEEKTRKIEALERQVERLEQSKQISDSELEKLKSVPPVFVAKNDDNNMAVVERRLVDLHNKLNAINGGEKSAAALLAVKNDIIASISRSFSDIPKPLTNSISISQVRAEVEKVLDEISKMDMCTKSDLSELKENITLSLSPFKEFPAKENTGYLQMEAIGNSMGKIAEFLQKNVELQNQSEQLLSHKMAEILAASSTFRNRKSEASDVDGHLVDIKQSVIAITRSLAADSASSNVIDADAIKKIVGERTAELTQLWQSVAGQVARSKSIVDPAQLKSLEKKLDTIHIGIDQTQSMVLSSHVSHEGIFESALKGLENVSKDLNSCFDEFTLISAEKKSENTHHAAVFESTFVQTIEKSLEDKFAALKKEFATSETDGGSRTSRFDDVNGESTPTRARSLSPRKLMTEFNYQEQLSTMSRNMSSLKDRLNSFISTQLTDNSQKEVSSKLNTLCDNSDWMVRNVKNLQNTVQNSDQEWKSELRKTMRSHQEALSSNNRYVNEMAERVSNMKLPSGKEEKSVAHLKSGMDDLRDMIKALQHAVKSNEIKTSSAGNDTQEEQFAMLGESIQNLQESFSRDMAAYSESLNGLIQDRELLMRENTRLLNELSIKQVNGTPSNNANGTAIMDEIKSLEERKEKLAKDISQQLGWLESLKTTSAKVKIEQREQQTQLHVQSLMDDIEVLKAKKNMIQDMIIGPSVSSSPTKSIKKTKRSASFGSGRLS